MTLKASFPYIVPGALIREFAERGFVITPNLLTANEIARYGTAIDEEVARRTRDDHRSVEDKTTYEQSFIQCMRLWETNPDVRPLSCHAGLAGTAVQLLGVEGVRMWQDQALYKEAGGRETTPHQDQTFWPLGDEPLVSAWIPLQDVTLDTGAMAYVPGSHRAGRLKVVDITHSTDPYDILKDPALTGVRPVDVEVTAGSVVWHHGLTVHQARANTSDRVRRVFTVVYISDRARRMREWPAFPLDRDGVGVGELVEGPGMPRLWPPPNELPQPPAEIGGATGPQHH